MIKTSCRGISSFILLSVLLLISAASDALPFTIVPTPGTLLPLPTEVISGLTTTAFYTITNNTSSVRTGNYIKYLPPNVSQVTVSSFYSGLCGSTFTLNPRGTAGSSCTLMLTVSGAVDASDPDPRHHLFACFPGGATCAGTPNPLNVSVVAPPLPVHAYVVNFGANTISLCTVNPSTGKLGLCQDSGVGAFFNAPALIALNPTGTRAYVSDFGGGAGTTVFMCAVNSSTGRLSDCVNADGDGSAVFGGPLGITLNASGTFVYVANIASNTVNLCSVNLSTGKFSECVSTGDIAFSAPIVVFVGTHAYVTNIGSNQVVLCSVNSNTGALSGCQDSGGTGFTGPQIISLDPSATRAYVSNEAGTVSLCVVNLITGQLSGCANADADGSAIFNAPVAVTINASGTQIYVSNNGFGGTTVSLCSINPITGQLSGCVNSDADGSAVFSEPAGVTLD